MQRTCKIFLWMLLAVTAVPAFAQSNTTAAKPVPSAREVAQRTLPSVVILMIETDKTNKIIERFKFGSGFFVSPDVVATNYHVIANGIDGFMKVVGQDAEYQILGVVGVDRANDLALVKIKGANGKPLPVGNSGSVAVGDEIYAVGNPRGLEGTFSQGIVSSVRKDGARQVIQITAPISQGSSGGPILNARGEVIGVAFGGIIDGQALNFAVPSSALKTLAANPQPVKHLAALERSSEDSTGEEVSEATAETNQPASAPKRPKGPRLSTDDVAVSKALSNMPGRGAVTELSFSTVDNSGRKREVTYKSDECSFALNPSFASSLDRNRDGLVDNMQIEIKCLKGSHYIEFATTNMGLNIAPSFYDKVFTSMPPAGYPYFHINSSNWNCSSPSDTTIQVYDAQFEIGRLDSRIISFGATFEQTCSGNRQRGNIYINYVK
jgi:S1-C subfamily serine protease